MNQNLSNDIQLLIMVHGTFAENSDWWKPEGPFCTKIKTKLKQAGINIQCSLPEECKYKGTNYFHWNGKNSEQAREDASRELTKLIQDILLLKRYSTIHIVSHSHGGNIAVEAIKHLHESEYLNLKHFGDNLGASQNMGATITLGTPFIRKDRRFHHPGYKESNRFTMLIGWLVGVPSVLVYLFALDSMGLTHGFLTLPILFVMVPILMIVFVGFLAFLDSFFNPNPRPRVINPVLGTFPHLAIVRLQNDEAITLLSEITQRAYFDDELPGRISPLSVDLRILPRIPRLQGELENFLSGLRSEKKKGFYDFLVTAIIGALLAVILLPVWVVDNVLGRATSLVTSIVSLVAVKIALMRAAKMACGYDQSFYVFLGAHKTPMDITWHEVEISCEEESELSSKAADSIGDLVAKIYSGSSLNIGKIFDPKEKIEEVFADLDLVHNSYHQSEYVADIVVAEICQKNQL
jgi:hypothetical protein